jgi:hypothetical protein
MKSGLWANFITSLIEDKPASNRAMRGQRLRVEVVGSKIIVAMLGTSFKVTYEKSQDVRGLVATSFHGRNRQETKITLPEFLALAWTAANSKARDLDWRR